MSGGFMLNLFKKMQLTDEEDTREMNFGLAKVIKYADLKKATNNFATEIGNGGFGTVYLGKLGDGKMVAVKVLTYHHPKQLEQFFNEVSVLSRLRHKNVVPLYGCTNPRSDKLLLVYEYVSNGTVADHLHGRRGALSWAKRIRIAVETAEALEYLHGLEPPVIHRDVKTPNILLDDNFHVKVADLGMCRLVPYDNTHVLTLPCGTMGYRDPEYERYFRLTDRADVYSFGVVLLELITGQRAVDVNRDPEDIYLDRMGINKIINKKLEEFVYPKLRYHTNKDTRRMIDSVAKLAGECLKPIGGLRPAMAQIVAVLKRIQKEMQGAAPNEGDLISCKPQQELADPRINNVYLKPFTFMEVKAATSDFSPDSVIGKGIFGILFKGWIDGNTLGRTKPGTGIAIAVKRFNHEEFQGYRESLANLDYLGRLSHPNLIRLIGYCLEDEECLLIYEFMPRGSSENHISRRGSYVQTLTWNLRMKAALRAAYGLSFLHGADVKVIYRNFNASIVLLDSNNNAKLSDVGLAKDGPTGDESHASTRYEEYLTTGHLTLKCDVYCLGVILLELLSGQREMDKNRPYFTSKLQLFRVLDLSLEGHYPLEAAFKLASLAIRCLSSDGKCRPNMDEVVSVLEGLQETQDTARELRTHPE